MGPNGLSSPGHFGKDSPIDFDGWFAVVAIDSHFFVVRSEEVLTDDGEVEVFGRSPSESHVHGDIAWCIADGEFIDIPEEHIELPVFGNVPIGLYTELILRIGWCVPDRGADRSDRIWEEVVIVEVQIGVGSSQSPLFGCFPAYGPLETIGFGVSTVMEGIGNDPVSSGIVRVSRGVAHQVTIAIIKQGDIPCETIGGLSSVAKFIGEDVFTFDCFGALQLGKCQGCC